jgi:Spy/CpxP family protein refolding chaperone
MRACTTLTAAVAAVALSATLALAQGCPYADRPYGRGGVAQERDYYDEGRRGGQYYSPRGGPRHGRGWGMMGPGQGRMGPRWGMMGPGRGGMEPYSGAGPQYGFGPDYEGWQEMSPAQRQAFRGLWSEYMNDTLELRRKLADRQTRLETLWAQPRVDEEKVARLSQEVADLRARLEKKRDQYILRCRDEFGDRGWTCPAGGGYQP